MKLLIALLFVAVVGMGCVQTPDTGGSGAGTIDPGQFMDSQEDLQTGSGEGDITADELEGLENDLEDLIDIENALDTEIGDSGIEDSTFE